MTRSADYRDLVEDLERNYLLDDEKKLLRQLRLWELGDHARKRTLEIEDIRTELIAVRKRKGASPEEKDEDAHYSWEDVYRQMRCEI